MNRKLAKYLSHPIRFLARSFYFYSSASNLCGPSATSIGQFKTVGEGSSSSSSSSIVVVVEIRWNVFPSLRLEENRCGSAGQWSLSLSLPRRNTSGVESLSKRRFSVRGEKKKSIQVPSFIISLESIQEVSRLTQIFRQVDIIINRIQHFHIHIFSWLSYLIRRKEIPFTLLDRRAIGGHFWWHLFSLALGKLGYWTAHLFFMITFSLSLSLCLMLSLHWRPSTCRSQRSIGFLRR